MDEKGSDLRDMIVEANELVVDAVLVQNAIGEGLASLLDEMSELVAALAVGDAPTKGWAFTVIETNAKAIRTLGHTPNVRPADYLDWQDQA